MMFGFRDEFAYFECSNCHCLQIAEVPKDLSKYYPRNYYSFSSFQLPKPGRIRRFLRQKRVETGLFGKGGLIGKLVYAVAPWEYLRAQSLAQVSLTRKSRILDVGCGNGDLLYILREIGFENLQGIDAYIDADIERDNGTKIRKATIQNVSGKWDLVMFHH
jgi:SAM-dependent methyltransferase